MNMKRIFIMILTVSAFCALNAGVSEEKSLNKDDDFLRNTPNIQNEELRFELANLKKQFNLDKSRIHDLYAEKMDALKSASQNEIKSLKNDFASRRELLFNKYPPIKHNKLLRANPNAESKDAAPTDITPDNNIKPKSKKRVRNP